MSAPHPVYGENEHDKRLHGPQTARGRLYEWSYTRHWPELNVWPPESAMYAVLHNPGRSTAVQSDGGMAAFSDRYSVAIEKWQRTVETGQAIDMMPADYRKVVHAMYRVEKRERPRELIDAAAIAGLPIPTFRKAMDTALAWLQGRLDLTALRIAGDCEIDAGQN